MSWEMITNYMGELIMTEIRFSGFGGQGIVRCGLIAGKALSLYLLVKIPVIVMDITLDEIVHGVHDHGSGFIIDDKLYHGFLLVDPAPHVGQAARAVAVG